MSRTAHRNGTPARSPGVLRRLRPAAAVALGLLVVCAAPAGGRADDDWTAWLAALRAEAVERGIRPETVEAALAGVAPRPRVLELDRSQPGAPKGYCRYMERRLTPTRIERGRRLLVEHRDLLDGLADAYGVPPRYLVALWGLESNFGDYQGDHPLFDALVTLARDPRRGDLFRSQIFAALRIVEAGHRPADALTGSWAGAMGQVQFMPTTFLAYAVDHDGDGRKDIWASVPDALASAAHFLRRSGWRSGETWGRPVRLPDTLHGQDGLDRSRRLDDWRSLGVRRADGGELPAASLRGRIVQPVRTPQPAFLVYPNYQTFLSWNRSTFFSISVGALADALVGRAPMVGCAS